MLLLDEITVDLDVLGRADLMKFLTQECEKRRATIIYATHIFDGLDSWPTHVAFLARGKLRRMHSFEELRAELEAGRLLELVEGWLRHEEAEAEAERQGKSDGNGVGAGGASSLRGSRFLVQRVGRGKDDVDAEELVERGDADVKEEKKEKEKRRSAGEREGEQGGEVERRRSRKLSRRRLRRRGSKNCYN